MQTEDNGPDALARADEGTPVQRAFEAQSRLPLGAGAIISACFSIFFRHIVRVLLIGLVPMVLAQGIPLLMIGYATNFDQPTTLELQDSYPTVAGLTAFMMFMLLLVYTFTTGLLVQLAYDAKLNRRIRIGRYLRPALTAIPAILILSVAIILLLLAGQFVLMMFGAVSPFLAIVALPATFVFYLWILGTFSVLAPSVIIERVGFRGLGRSASLTKDYRWPIIGTLFLIGMCTLGLYIAAGFVIGLISLVVPPLVGSLLFGALSTAGTGILSIAVSLVYARLREIKEGIGLDEIAAVFD